MTVIVFQEIDFDGKTIQARSYLSSNRVPLTRSAREQADKLDTMIEKNMRAIEEEMRGMGLLELKNRAGVLRLWYEVGKRLKFVEELDMIPVEEQKYVWQALYDHAGELSPSPGPVGSRGLRPLRNHFRYCHLLASKFPDYGFVESVCDWREWREVFDTPTIQNDARIIDWIAAKRRTLPRKDNEWVLKLITEIRREFPATKETTVFSQKELTTELDAMYQREFPEQKH